MLSTWAEFRCKNADSRRDTLRAALAPFGVSIDESPDVPDTIGLLVFDEWHSDIPNDVREITRGGLRRALLLEIGANSSAEDYFGVLNAGAGDVLSWTGLEPPAAELAARVERWATVDTLLASPIVRENIVGASRAWFTMLRELVESAAFSDDPILLLGESGTGKELLARLVHAVDRRPTKRDLVVLDCASVLPELSGSEFFGHEKGAFTGAHTTRDGALALADQGTLFLDEVGELSPSAQAQLLRAVQEHTFKRVGGNSWTRTSFRLVCATHRDLPNWVENGRFRLDFFHRIASRIIRVPPLKDRVEDVVPLALHFLAEQQRGYDLALHHSVCKFLQQRTYPGNVRELRQLVRQMGDRHVGSGPITPGDIPPHERSGLCNLADWREGSFEKAIERAVGLGGGLREISKAATETAIRVALASEQGNLQRAARRLGVTDRALQLRRAQRL